MFYNIGPWAGCTGQCSIYPGSVRLQEIVVPVATAPGPNYELTLYGVDLELEVSSGFGLVVESAGVGDPDDDWGPEKD